MASVCIAGTLAAHGPRATHDALTTGVALTAPAGRSRTSHDAAAVSMTLHSVTRASARAGDDT